MLSMSNINWYVVRVELGNNSPFFTTVTKALSANNRWFIGTVELPNSYFNVYIMPKSIEKPDSYVMSVCRSMIEEMIDVIPDIVIDEVVLQTLKLNNLLNLPLFTNTSLEGVIK